MEVRRSSGDAIAYSSLAVRDLSAEQMLRGGPLTGANPPAHLEGTDIEGAELDQAKPAIRAVRGKELIDAEFRPVGVAGGVG